MRSLSAVAEYQRAISSNYSMLENVDCVADRLKIHMEQSCNAIEQNMFYNGWKDDHYVGNVFVFTPSGLIIACTVNSPRAIHKYCIADWRGFYAVLCVAL
eukprot:IDg11300t1